MFKHILLPTDGSKLSERAARIALQFAGKIRARVTALHVVPAFRAFANEGFAPLSPALKKRLEDEARARAARMLDAIARQARSRRVRCATLTAASDLPYQEIIDTALKVENLKRSAGIHAAGVVIGRGSGSRRRAR